LNRVDWYAAYNFTRPYPGDRAILTPEQVAAGPGKGVGAGSDG
jgi:hypothetical protein